MTDIINRRIARKGLTLIELLIVVAIMVMLVAVSVPAFKPMLESQRTTNAADAVAAMLNAVRFKAIEEQEPYGIEFIRYPEATNLCLQMRMTRRAPFYTGSGGGHLGITVQNGGIHLHQFNNGWTELNAGADEYQHFVSSVPNGAGIKFHGNGRTYALDKSAGGLGILAAPYNAVNLPPLPLPPTTPLSASQPMTFEIVMPPRPALLPPVPLPRGTVIDLQFSGAFSNTEIPFVGGTQSVLVMFSPAGYVENFYVNGNPFEPYNGLFYFCVGEWDRASTDPAGNTLAEDGLNNLLTVSNSWVTIHPRTGQVRISKNGFLDGSTELTNWQGSKTEANLKALLPAARKYASEHYRGAE